MSTFNELVISGEGCHGHFVGGGGSDPVKNKTKFLRRWPYKCKKQRTCHVIHFIPRI